MASKKLIVQMIASIKTLYSYYAKDTDVKALVNLWGMTLQEFPDDITQAAFVKALQTCKVPPTPADVIEHIKAIVSANEPADEELWNEFTKVLPKVREYTHRIRVPLFGDPVSPHKRIKNVYKKLPDKVQQYIGSTNELKRMAQYSDEDLKFEKTKFLKAMPTIQKRQEYSSLKLEDNADKKLMIE